MKKRKKRKKRARRNWLVEDNLVALYIALYKYKGLNYDLGEIEKIITHKRFPMRIEQFRAVDTDGEIGLVSGLQCLQYNDLHKIFKDFKQKKFANLVNWILKVKSNLDDC